jgi:hypothetical protein
MLLLLLFVSASIQRGEEASMVFLLKEADTKRRSIHGVPTKGRRYKEKKKHPWYSY